MVETRVIEVTPATGAEVVTVTDAFLVGSPTLVAVTTIDPVPVATRVRNKPAPDNVPGPVIE